MSNLKVEISKQNGKTIAILSGIIDQSFRIDVIDQLDPEETIFDFKKIELINSLGVRELISFLKSLTVKRLIYQNCPCILVNQFNMVKGLVPINCKVVSFYAPYYAPIGQEELEIPIETADVKDGKAPKRRHPKTGEDLTFDDLEERYFYFLKGQK
jgi:hypothetical protein